LNQLIVAKLAQEEFGISIAHVQEIINVPEITRIPNLPDFVEGIINLRGRIIPIVDLRKRFGFSVTQNNEDARIIVTNLDKQYLGLVADSVSEVIRLSSESIEPVPSIISRISSEYLCGVGKLDKRMIILLDLGKLLNTLERSQLKKVEKEISADDNSLLRKDGKNE